MFGCIPMLSEAPMTMYEPCTLVKSHCLVFFLKVAARFHHGQGE
jgi:hypothetical protein